jgi:hypothetical protein
MVKTGSCFAVRYWPNSSGRSIEGNHRSPGADLSQVLHAHPRFLFGSVQARARGGQFRLPFAGQYWAAVDSAAFVLVL